LALPLRPEVDYWSRALPRGAVTVIFDVGQRQQFDFYAADGTTKLSVPPAFITGSHLPTGCGRRRPVRLLAETIAVKGI
jgi:hypothetical protein